MLSSEGQAKRFFVEKVLAQAIAERDPLSAAQRQMLSWSESDPEFTPAQSLVEQLQAEISDEDYEAKVTGLLKRAYRRDLESGRDARGRWKDAYDTLNEGDHYLLVMIDRGVGRHLRPWWAIWR